MWSDYQTDYMSNDRYVIRSNILQTESFESKSHFYSQNEVWNQSQNHGRADNFHLTSNSGIIYRADFNIQSTLNQSRQSGEFNT